MTNNKLAKSSKGNMTPTSSAADVLKALGLDVGLNESAQELNEAKAAASGWVQDPDEVVFKQFGFGKKRGMHTFLSMAWSEAGKPSNELRSQVDAVRGFVLRSKNGFILWAQKNDAKSDDQNNAEKKDKKARGPICRSICSEYGDFTLKGDRSYPFPHFWTPQAFSDGPIPGVPDQAVEDVYKLIGSRGKSCADCVRAGENTDGNSYCSTNSSIVFAVTEYGIERDGEISWHPITKYSTSPDGKPLYDKPVIIHGLISKTAYRKYQAFENNETNADSFIPGDCKNFYQYASSLNSKGRIISVDNPMNPVLWPEETELYLATPAASDAPTASIPVFRSSGRDLTTDPSVATLYNACLQQYEAALSEYAEEKKYDFGGPVGETRVPRLTPKAKTVVAEEVKEVEVKVVKEDAVKSPVVDVDEIDEGFTLDLTTFAD